MMSSKTAAWLGIGGLFALVGLGWAIDRPPATLRNPRRRRVRESRDLVDNPRPRRRRRRAPTLARLAERQVDDCERSARRFGRPTTFKLKAEAVRGLLDVNPELMNLVESDCGHDCAAYVTWANGGRRGPKPRARKGDGRFDPLNERWERRTPGRKVASWKEALAVTAPSSRRWADFAERLPVLEEAVGFRLNLPERTERATMAQAAGSRCQDIRPVLVVLEEAPF